MQSTFFPGDKWIYLKIYCGPSYSNMLLKKHILTIVQELYDTEVITKWFFIRYQDPDFHIRFRIQLADQNDSGRIYAIINGKLQKDISTNQIWKIQIEPYQRELSRYGKNNINIIETLFCADSFYVCKMHGKFSVNENSMLLLAMTNLDLTFKKFGFSFKERKNLYETIRDNLKKEFQIDLKHKKKLNVYYRENVSTKFKEFKNNHLTSPTLERKLETYRKNFPLIKGDDETLWNVYFGLNHMHCNRLFMQHQRLYEMISYDFLIQYYNQIIYSSK